MCIAGEEICFNQHGGTNKTRKESSETAGESQKQGHHEELRVTTQQND